MKDRSKHGTPKAEALIAAVLVLTAGAGLARAEEPAEQTPAEDTGAPAQTPAEDTGAPAATSVRPSAPVETAPTTSPPAVTPTVEAPPLPAEPPPSAVPAPPAEPLASAPLPGATSPSQPAAPDSWFARPPLTLVVGEGTRQFKLTIFGFVEVDYIYDTTRSYNDAMGSSLVQPDNTYAGRHSRSQFSMRNSRLGFAFESPTVGGVKPTAVLEADFFGHQDSPPETSESVFFDSPTFRVRHAYMKLETAYVDVVMGQTYDLFGWQNFSAPCSLQYLGLPNQLFSRNPQLRLSHGFNAEGAVGLDVAVSANRPAQRDSQIPDGHAGLRITLNRWLGLTTPGSVGTRTQPAGIGVSGIVRRFNVNAHVPPPPRASVSATGWGIAADAFVPVIPAAHEGDRSNRLTLVGSFVWGTGIADLITTGGNAQFPPLENPLQIIPWPEYEANIDSSLVTFDADGGVHTLNWLAFRAGVQYYLPPTGRLLFAANYTQSHSNNLWKLFLKGDALVELRTMMAHTSRYVDANLFWDATPALRLGISGQYTQVEYLDGNKPHNIRGMAQTVYVF